ncbi:hypothetical protein GCM10009623_10520 [Nocardioides aestuarii]|uniref:Carboxypeptidase regulatory-like domain-containing protein n=1 Tax=Nocardioides aestuarii TaxID=252231 RepID=A0ABW4TKN2_9ACTN
MAGRLAHLVCLTLGITTLGFTPAAADTGMDDGRIDLPLVVADVVPDPVNGTVWTRGYEGVQVADTVTGTVTQVPVGGYPRDLAIDPTGEHAYAVWDNAVSIIDTTTLTTRTLDLGTNSCPTDVAAADGLIHLYDGCHTSSPYRALDAVDGSPRDPLAEGRPIGVPGRHRVLYWSGDHLAVVDTTTMGVIAERDVPYLEYRQPLVSSDGTKVLLDGTDDIVRVRDLDTLRAFASSGEAEPNRDVTPNLDVRGESLLVADYGLDVVDLASSAPVHTLRPWDSDSWFVVGVTATPGSTIVAATSMTRTALFLEDDPGVPSAELVLERPFPDDGFSATPVTGTLMADGAPLAGEPVSLTGRGVVPVETVTDDQGRFSTSVYFPEPTTLVARWPGNAQTPPAVSQSTVQPPPADTLLTLGVPRQVDPSDPLPVSVHLRTGRGADVPGYDVTLHRRCHDDYAWTPLTTVTTGPDGRVTFDDEPPACLEVEYLALHERTGMTLPSSTEESTTVTWGSSSLEVTVPTDVVVGDTATTRARLLVRGLPAAGRTLTLTSTEGGSWERVTDAEGRASVDVPVPFTTNLTWRFAGEASVLPATSDHLVHARKLDTVLSVSATPTSIRVTEPISMTGQVLDENGDAVVGAEIRLGRATGTVIGVTDQTGSVRTEVAPARWDPDHLVQLTFPGDDRHETSAGSQVVDVRPLTSSLTVVADRDEVSADHPVRLSGTVSAELADDVDDRQLRVWRTEPDGNVTGLPWVDVEPDGSFGFTDRPPQAGRVTYTVTRLADARYAMTEAQTSVDVVEQLPVALTLSTDQQKYVAGDLATVTVRTDRDTDGTLTLVADPAEGPETVLHEGPITGAGVSVDVELLTTSTLSATLSETLDRTGATARVERQVRLRMSSRLKGSWARRDGAWLVSPRTRPRVVTDIVPPREGVCVVHEQQQRRRNGSWTSPRIIGCRDTDSDGTATYRSGRRPVGTTWRVRAVTRNDGINALTRGAFLTFKIRRPR